MSRPKPDLTGKQFGLLSVVSLDPNGKTPYHWSCRCACGKTKSVRTDALVHGKILSCGCMLREGKRLRGIHMATFSHGGEANPQENFTCDGCGATFLCYPSKRPLPGKYCTRACYLRNHSLEGRMQDIGNQSDTEPVRKRGAAS